MAKWTVTRTWRNVEADTSSEAIEKTTRIARPLISHDETKAERVRETLQPDPVDLGAEYRG